MNEKPVKRKVVCEADTRGIVGLIARIRELANEHIERELERRGLTGIVPAHGTALSYLFRQDGPIPMLEIAANTGRCKSTITGMVNTLETHGYLHKIPSEADGRVVLVELSKKGYALRREFEEISKSLLTTVYGEMPETDRKTLIRLLNALYTNLSTSLTDS